MGVMYNEMVFFVMKGIWC